MPCRKHKNPPVSVELALAIRDGMARYLWVSAVADYTEEHSAKAQMPYPPDGEDWDSVVSQTPHAAQQAADDLIALFAANEKLPADEVMLHLFELAATIDVGTPIELDPAAYYEQVRAPELENQIAALTGKGVRDKHNREQLQNKLESLATVADVAMSFGADMAAQALGTGVAWSDDHKVKRDTAEFKPVIPSFECHFDGEDLTWSGRGQDSSDRKSGHEHTRTPRITWVVREIFHEDTDDEEVNEIAGDPQGQSLRPSTAEAEMGWTIVDKAVAYLHAESNRAHHEIEPSFHGSPHTLTQGPARKLTYTISDDAFPDPEGGTVRMERVYAIDGTTWIEQTEIFERIYREEWEPRPTQIGRITVVNPDDINSWMNTHRYVLWFDAHAPRFLMAYGDSLDVALDYCVDWLEEQGLEGFFADEAINDEYNRLIREGVADTDAREQAEVDTTSAGNHGRYLNSEDWGIAAENPNDEQLRALGRGDQ